MTKAVRWADSKAVEKAEWTADYLAGSLADLTELPMVDAMADCLVVRSAALMERHWVVWTAAPTAGWKVVQMAVWKVALTADESADCSAVRWVGLKAGCWVERLDWN